MVVFDLWVCVWLIEVIGEDLFTLWEVLVLEVGVDLAFHIPLDDNHVVMVLPLKKPFGEISPGVVFAGILSMDTTILPVGDFVLVLTDVDDGSWPHLQKLRA